MAANERLTLQIDTVTTGQQQVQAMSDALNKVINIADKAGKSGSAFSSFPSAIKGFVQDPLAAAETSLTRFATGFGPVGMGVAATVTTLSAFAVASASATRSLAALGVETQNLSLKTGLTVKEVGAFSFAAKATGTDVDLITSAMRKLSLGLTEGGADGKKAADGLRELGVQTRTSSGELRSTGDIFGQVSESLNRLGVTAETRTAMIKAFGRGAVELIPLFTALNGKVEQFNQMGLGLSGNEMAKFKALQDQITTVDAKWDAAKRHISEGIAGTIWLDVKGSGAAILEIMAGNHPNAPVASASQTNQFRQGQGLPPLPGTAPADRFGSLLQSAAGLADTAAGSKIVQGFGLSRLATPEGLTERTKELEEKNANLQAKLQGGGIGEVSARTTVAEINKNQREIDSLKERVKNIEAVRGIYEGIGKRVAEANGSLDGPASKVYGELDDAVSKGASRSRLQGAFDTIASRALDSGMDAMRETDARGGLRYSGAIGDVIGGGALFRGQRPLVSTADQGRHLLPETPEEQIPETNRRVRNLLDSLNRYNSERDEMTRKTGESALTSINRTGDFQSRLVSNAPDLTQAQKISDLNRIDLETARLRYEAELKTAGGLSLEKDRKEAIHAAEVRNEGELQRIREDNALRLADLENQRLQNYKSAIGGLFDAATSRQPNAIPQFFKSQALGIGRTITENIAGEAFKSIEKLTPHATGGTFLGKLLNNTPFGADPIRASASALDTSAAKLSDAADDLKSAAQGGGSAGGTGGGPSAFGSSPLSSVPGASGLSKLLSGGFTGGASSVLSGSALSILFGTQPGAPGSGAAGMPASWTTLPGTAASLSQRIGAGVGLGASLAAGGYGIYSGLKEGGVGGDLKAAGSAAGMTGEAVANISKLLGATGPLLSAIPIVGSIAALALPLLGGLFGNNPQRRENAINQEIAANQYMAPTSIAFSQDSSGHYADFSARGDLRTSNFSPYPETTNPFLWEQSHGLLGGPSTFYDVPGRTTQPYSPAAAPAVIVNHNYASGAIQAMDAGSFHDFAQRNSRAIGDAAGRHLQDAADNSRLGAAIHYITRN